MFVVCRCINKTSKDYKSKLSWSFLKCCKLWHLNLICIFYCKHTLLASKKYFKLSHIFTFREASIPTATFWYLNVHFCFLSTSFKFHSNSSNNVVASLTNVLSFSKYSRHNLSKVVFLLSVNNVETCSLESFGNKFVHELLTYKCVFALCIPHKWFRKYV